MLTKTRSFNPVTAYHITNHDRLLYNHTNNIEHTRKKQLTIRLQQHGVKDRGIDRLQPTADFAEEYGFYLDAISPDMTITPHNITDFKRFAQKIQYIAQNHHPLLLKNPYDFGNSYYIKQHLPNAKFIFIHRHPYKTLSSLIKAVRVLFQTKNHYASEISRLYNQLYPNPLTRYSIRLLTNQLNVLGTLLLLIHTAHSTRGYLKTLPQLPTDSYINITYESLCHHPQKTMQHLLTFLHITPEEPQDFTTYIQPRKTTLDPAVYTLRRLIYTCLKPYFSMFSYTPENYS